MYVRLATTQYRRTTNGLKVRNFLESGRSQRGESSDNDGTGDIMKFVRFIGEQELATLLRDGEVSPIHKTWSNFLGYGVAKSDKCIWLFPEHSQDYNYCGNDTPEDRLMYCSGIVTDMTFKLDGKDRDGNLAVHLSLPDNEDFLVRDIQSYADPYGSYFATMDVVEYNLKRPYLLSEVVGLDMYYQPEMYRTYYKSISSLKDTITVDSIQNWWNKIKQGLSS